MHVPQQVDHRVGLGGPLPFGLQERHRAQRHVGAQRGDAGGVDQGVLPQPGAGHLHLEVVDLLGGPAEVDLDGAGHPVERAGFGAAVAQVGGPRVGGAVGVPSDDPGALAGVGGRQLLADQGVEQRRLPGLDLAGDGHP